VILLDQRGLGESSPKVDCPAAQPLPADLFERPERLQAAFEMVYRACAAAHAPAAVPADFTIDRVADDVEAVRRAIGVAQLDLLAFSFGSRLALEVLRRHPGRIRRVVLQGVLGLDTVRMPEMEERTFRRFSLIAEAQAAAKGLAPSLDQALRAVQARADRAPLRLTVKAVDGRAVEVAIGRTMLDALLVGRLGDPNLPAVLTAAAGGDDSLLAFYAQSLYQDLEQGAGSLMARAMVCSAASAPVKRRAASAAGPRTLLGEAFDNRMQSDAFCRGLGVPPPAAAAAVDSRAPVLLISGTLDPRTPPERAEVTAKALTASEHLVIEHGGHELLPVREVQDRVVAFLDGKPDRQPIVLAPPEVRSIEEARRPPRPRR
jgi:pimeloyl-ACP methyl ester carboxylesterase